MIGIVFTMLIPNSKHYIEEKISTKLPWAIYPVMFGLGILRRIYSSGYWIFIDDFTAQNTSTWITLCKSS